MAKTKQSAGIVLWRRSPNGQVEILLVHPGGPFWANKDQHAWSIPKGEYEAGDNPEETAVREFTEELGHPVPSGKLSDLGEIRSSSKNIRAYALEGDLDETMVNSNTFTLEWPPRSGQLATFPEVDKAEWVPLGQAALKLHKGQGPLVALVEAQTSSSALGENPS